MFVTVSVLYRPVEQLLARTIAQGGVARRHLRVAVAIQAVLGGCFLVVALALRPTLRDELFGGSDALYWTLVATVLAYSASYFARGVLAGRGRPGAYGGLVATEAIIRLMFAVAVAVGLAAGESFVALGMAVAPVVSLVVVSSVAARTLSRAAATDRAPGPDSELTLAGGAGYTSGALAIMLAEQTFLNAGPLVVNAASGAALAGAVFNALLIARAPMQLFQAVQATILPHLARLRARGEADPFRRSVGLTVGLVAAFAALAAGVLALAGPELMELLFGAGYSYGRGGLVLVALGMGAYLAASTLTQALLARGRAGPAAVPWLAAAAGFTAFVASPAIEDPVLRVEAGYALAAAALAGGAYLAYRVTD